MQWIIRIGLILVFAFILLPFESSSQNQAKADSFRTLLDNRELSSHEELKAYYWLSAYSTSPEDELRYGLKLLELAKKANNQEYIIKSNQRIGVAHRLMGNLGKALNYLFESANNAVGTEKYKLLLADAYTEISTCYTQNGDSENAFLYGLKTIEILRKTDKKQALALNLLNIGYDYYLIGNYDSAMAYYNESESILKEIDMVIGLAYLTGNRALVYWKNGEIEKAKKDIIRAIEKLESFNDLYGQSDYYNQLGYISLEENNQNQGIIYANKGLALAKKEGLKEQTMDASYLLFQLHQKNNDFKEALKFQTQYYTYKDSIQNLETTQKLANLRTGFEVGKKQAEVDLLVEQRRGNRIIMITGGIVLFVVICLAIIIFYYSKSKTKLNLQLEKQKDSLLVLNNTKDKFFSIISHDLRGPVSSLSSLISVSKYYLDDSNTEKVKEMLLNMENSADRLINLLDNLLHWALQQSGHFPYVPEKVSLRNVLREVVDMFSDMATSKNIGLKLDMKEDFDVLIDKNSISTIFRNLLNNAIKFTNHKGQIEILTEVDKSSDMAVIKIMDNGVGIPKGKLDILFKLNENLTTKGTSGESGLGLGLQLVYEFVQVNKGKIDVVSKEGQGTTFIVQLPLHP